MRKINLRAEISGSEYQGSWKVVVYARKAWSIYDWTLWRDFCQNFFVGLHPNCRGEYDTHEEAVEASCKMIARAREFCDSGAFNKTRVKEEDCK